MSGTTHSVTEPGWRITPSVPVALGVFVVYAIVFIGLSGSSGVAYDHWFDSAPNIWRTVSKLTG